MGIDRQIAKLLLWTHSQGVDFARPLTIGRMGLHLSTDEMAEALALFGIRKSSVEVAALFAEQDGYAEPLLQLLGARVVASLDASGFEGATVIHDLNRRIPVEWHGRYSVVFDGGTLEHVFEYPTALRNCLEMVAVGGHFITVTPANNYMGHGFYQFSPELYARVLHDENGFNLEKMILFEYGADQWYEVIDPAKAGSRVSLVNHRPTMLVACARRTRLTEIFAKPPQQSDYSEEWSDWTGADTSQPRKCREAGRQQKPWLKRWLRGVRKWFKPRFPEKFYKPLDITR